MIKKLVSKALLSAVMDKEARENLARLQAAKSPDSADSGEKPARTSAPAKPPAKAKTGLPALRAEDMPRNVRVRSPALADDDDGPLLGDLLGGGGKAEAKAAPSASSGGGGGGLDDDEDPIALVERAVAEARKSLGADAPGNPARRLAATRAPRPRPSAARGVEPRGVEPRGVELRGVEPRGVEPRGVEPRGVEPKGIEPRGVEPKSAEPKKAAPAPAPKAAPKDAPKGAPKGGGGMRAPNPGAPGSERERLITEAMSIHSEKSRLLDQLAPELKEQLRLLALKHLDPKAYEKIRREALGPGKKQTAR